jgi:type II secretory pathway component PulF
MAERPELFPPFYIAFVRAGEIGGVLDEALAYLAAWLEQERAAAERLRTNILLAQLTARVRDGAAASGIQRRVAEALQEARRVARVASFCRLFEMCLTAGVPMKLALATAADILPEPAAKQVREGAEALAADAPVAPVLAEVAELETIVSRLVATGEEHACLDHMLRKAAEFYDAEAADVLHRAARLPAEA